MQNQTLKTIAGLIITGALLPAEVPSSTPSYTSAIRPAVAWSSGAMKINGTDHIGNGNVLPGGQVEMLRSPGQVYLADGSRLRLGADSRMTVTANNVSLDTGVARVDSVGSAQVLFSLSAGELRISSKDGVISRPASGDVVLTASKSPMEVRNSTGFLLAMVRPGETLAFAMGKASAKAKAGEMTGVVREESGKFFITDNVTNVKAEIRGAKPANWKNRCVHVKGDMEQSSGPNAIIHLKEIDALDDCNALGAGSQSATAGSQSATAAQSATVAGKAAAAGKAAGAATAGVSKAVILGVIVTTGAVAGTSLALVNSQDPAPISR